MNKLFINQDFKIGDYVDYFYLEEGYRGRILALLPTNELEIEACFDKTKGTKNVIKVPISSVRKVSYVEKPTTP